MKKQVYFPTNNIGKYERYKKSFENLGIEYNRYFIDSNGNELKVDVIEDGKTLEENAKKKAKAYYDEYKKYIDNNFSIITTDEALYIEGLKEDEQPGMFVRRFNGLDAKRATDEEVVERYTSFVRKIGGEAKAKWIYSLVMYDGEKYSYYSWDEEVLFSDTPHFPITKGYVLNNITIVRKENDINIMLSDLTEDERFNYLSKYTDNVSNFVNKNMNIKDFKEYEVLLFDLDDTLINNQENVRYAFKKVCNTLNIEYTDDLFKKWFDFDKSFWIKFHQGDIIVPDEYNKSQPLFVKYVQSLRFKLFFELDINTSLELNNLFLNSLREVVFPIDGAYDTLEYLHDKYRIVIATNGPSEATLDKVTKIDCDKFIDTIFSADMTKNTVTKPKIGFFEELEDYIKFYDRSKMLIIGDSLFYDVLSGMNTKIDSIWYNPNDEELPKEYNPTKVIKQLNDLKNIL